ncbi:MAG: hypothetical protein ACI8ZN_001484 [Bacteroidia bacterium]
MAKKKVHIDQLFKDRFDSKSMGLDGGEWTRLQKELHPPKKKRFLLWWILPMLGLASLGVYLLFASQNVSNQDVAAQKVAKTTPLSSNDITQNTEISTSLDRLGNDNSKPIENANNYSNKSTHAPQTGSLKWVGNGPIRPMPENGPFISDTSIRRNPRFFSIRLLPKSLDAVLPFAPVLFLNLQLVPHFLRKDTPSTPTRKNWFVEYSAGLAASNPNISSTIADFNRYQKANEHTMLSPTFGVQIGRTLKSFEVSSGFNYQEKGLRYKNGFQHEIHDVRYFNPTSGDTIFFPTNFRDTSSSLYSGAKFGSVSVPFQIQKTFVLGRNERFSLSTWMRVQPQFLVHASGTQLSDALSPISINRYGFKSFNLNAAGGISLGCNINPRTSLYVNTAYTTDVFSMNKSNAIKQRFGTVEMRFVLRRYITF